MKIQFQKIIGFIWLSCLLNIYVFLTKKCTFISENWQGLNYIFNPWGLPILGLYLTLYQHIRKISALFCLVEYSSYFTKKKLSEMSTVNCNFLCLSSERCSRWESSGMASLSTHSPVRHSRGHKILYNIMLYNI